MKPGISKKGIDKSYLGGGTGFKRHSGNTVILADGTVKTYDRRNRRSVWSISAKAYKGAHFATFPEKLIEPMIMAGCRPGGTVLDPFAGAGTTGVVAKKLMRSFVGIEINGKYACMARKRISQTPAQINLI